MNCLRHVPPDLFHLLYVDVSVTSYIPYMHCIKMIDEDNIAFLSGAVGEEADG